MASTALDSTTSWENPAGHHEEETRLFKNVYDTIMKGASPNGCFVFSNVTGLNAGLVSAARTNPDLAGVRVDPNESWGGRGSIYRDMAGLAAKAVHYTINRDLSGNGPFGVHGLEWGALLHQKPETLEACRLLFLFPVDRWGDRVVGTGSHEGYYLGLRGSRHIIAFAVTGTRESVVHPLGPGSEDRAWLMGQLAMADDIYSKREKGGSVRTQPVTLDGSGNEARRVDVVMTDAL